MPEWLPHVSFATLALVAVAAIAWVCRLGKQLDNRDARIAKLMNDAVKAALRESELHLEVQVLEAEVGRLRAEAEFCREGMAFERGAAYDTRTRAIVR